MHGKRAPVPTRRLPRPEPVKIYEVEELPNGVTHIKFNYVVKINGDTAVIARDPVTRRLSRRKLKRGMSRTIGYYDQDGTLYNETQTDW
jgi:hypothetical protein